MREKTSLLEFGVDSADCSVQSAGSLLGGGLPKLAMMSGGSRTCDTMQRRQRPQAIYCFVQRCLLQDGKERNRQADEHFWATLPVRSTWCATVLGVVQDWERTRHFPN